LTVESTSHFAVIEEALMDSGDAIVTLKTLTPKRNPNESESESMEALPEAQTPEAKLRIARYQQIMERLEQESEDVGSDVMVAVQDRAASLAQSKVLEEATSARQLDSGGKEVQFGEGLRGGDWLRWIWSVTDWIDRSDAHPIRRPSAAAAGAIPDACRVGLTADWGTGLYGAPQIAAALRRQAATRKFDLLMHLGDIYYSGTEKEVSERFLKIWPSEAGTVNRALNGNHEMYSGGFGYFKLILPAFGQDCSYFAVQNDHWLLAGLDTAYVDHDMDNAQVAWLTLLVRQAQVPGPRKVVLFSHQQPFSRIGSQGPKLQQALKHLLTSGSIKAWYWGHEHDCIVYDAHPAWNLFGRCLGNGGIPQAPKDAVRRAPVDPQHRGGAGTVWRRLEQNDNAPGCSVLDGPNAAMKKDSDKKKFVPHGFMTLEFNGPSLTERVFLADGTEILSNTIT
jgi:hypothetical protein